MSKIGHIEASEIDFPIESQSNLEWEGGIGFLVDLKDENPEVASKEAIEFAP